MIFTKHFTFCFENMSRSLNFFPVFIHLNISCLGITPKKIQENKWLLISFDFIKFCHFFFKNNTLLKNYFTCSFFFCSLRIHREFVLFMCICKFCVLSVFVNCCLFLYFPGLYFVLRYFDFSIFFFLHHTIN
jgi:hypothetical protein